MGIFDFIKKKPNVDIKYETPNIDKQLKNQNLESWKKSNLAGKSARGLLPYEILMLNYVGSYSKEQPEYPRFWLYDFGIINPTDTIVSLIQRGYVVDADNEYNLSKLKVSEIKEILSQFGLSEKGKKAELVSRLLLALSEKDISNSVKTHYYKLSDLGKSELIDNEWVIFLHNHRYLEIKINDFSHVIAEHPKANYHDLLWGELNRRSIEYIKNEQYGLYRNNRYNMARFLMDEKKYSNAIPLLLETCYFDINILGIGSDYKKAELLNCSIIPRGVIESLHDCMEHANIPDNELFQMGMKQFKSIYPPTQLLSSADTAGYIISDLNGDVERMKIICHDAVVKL